jgi:hypothetical protein
MFFVTHQLLKRHKSNQQQKSPLSVVKTTSKNLRKGQREKRGGGGGRSVRDGRGRWKENEAIQNDVIISKVIFLFSTFFNLVSLAFRPNRGFFLPLFRLPADPVLSRGLVTHSPCVP